MAIKILLVTLGFCLANAFYIERKEPTPRHPYYLTEQANILEDNVEDALFYRVLNQPNHVRVARQVGAISSNPDGSMNINARLPLAGDSQNVLSAVASGQGLKDGKYGAAGAGLALNNVNGHGLSLTGTHMPDMGNQLTAAARANLLNTPDHNLNANAFITRTMPNHPQIPNFNTHGANLEYMFKNKVGATVGMAQTPLFQKTDYSAMGNLNLYRNPSSSLDFSAGVSKSVSPFIPSSRWQPSAGLSFTRYW